MNTEELYTFHRAAIEPTAGLLQIYDRTLLVWDDGACAVSSVASVITPMHMHAVSTILVNHLFCCLTP